MLDAFSAMLQACDPAKGCFRSYRIEAGTDLLGDWVVDLAYGRIGARGRIIRHVAIDEADARKIVCRCLQRRATARKRIGVGYRLCALSDPGRWMAGQAWNRPSPGFARIACLRTDRHRPPLRLPASRGS